MARLALCGLGIGMLLACAPSRTIVLNPDVPNTFERCKADCAAQGAGPPKVCVETEDTYRCFCTWPSSPGS
jgi:hypothetical protein